MKPLGWTLLLFYCAAVWVGRLVPFLMIGLAIAGHHIPLGLWIWASVAWGTHIGIRIAVAMERRRYDKALKEKNEVMENYRKMAIQAREAARWN